MIYIQKANGSESKIRDGISLETTKMRDRRIKLLEQTKIEHEIKSKPVININWSRRATLCA
jgi:hypothetical protein